MAEFDRIRAFFADWVATNGNRGAVGEVAQWLADGERQPARYSEIIARHGSTREAWLRDGLLGLAMAYAQHRFAAGPPSLDDVVEIRVLRAALHVHDTALFERYPGEISRLLQGVFEAVLADGVIENWEDMYLVEIQAAFGLSYDQLWTLAQPALERVVKDLKSEAAVSRGGGAAAVKLAALEPLYRLATLHAPRQGTPHWPTSEL